MILLRRGLKNISDKLMNQLMDFSWMSSFQGDNVYIGNTINLKARLPERETGFYCI